MLRVDRAGTAINLVGDRRGDGEDYLLVVGPGGTPQQIELMTMSTPPLICKPGIRKSILFGFILPDRFTFLIWGPDVGVPHLR